MPTLSADEIVHREIIKATGPLKAYTKQAKDSLKELTRLNIKHEAEKYNYKKGDEGIGNRYKLFMKHKDNLRDMFINPSYDGVNLNKYYHTYDHAKLKSNKRNLIIRYSNIVDIK